MLQVIINITCMCTLSVKVHSIEVYITIKEIAAVYTCR